MAMFTMDKMYQFSEIDKETIHPAMSIVALLNGTTMIGMQPR